LQRPLDLREKRADSLADSLVVPASPPPFPPRRAASMARALVERRLVAATLDCPSEAFYPRAVALH
jgi:hypothetical protein